MNYEKSQLMKDIESMDMDSTYPRGLKLHPKTDLHKKLLARINERAEMARPVIDGAKPHWKKVDWALNAFVPANEAEARTKAKDWRRPVNMVIPTTFASLETFLTYMHSTFVQNPIHKYRGQGDHRVATMLLERLIQRQAQWFKEALHLNTLWRDSFAYGLGAAHVRWSKHRVIRSAPTEVTELLRDALRGTPFASEIGDIISVPEERVAYEGNELEPIDPYRLLLDPNSTPNEYQKAEFIGWTCTTHIYDLAARAGDEEERLFNIPGVRVLAEKGQAHNSYTEDESGRGTRYGMESTSRSIVPPNAHPVELTRMFINLIPSEWGIGDEDRPEKWMFTVAGEQIIIQADRLEEDHGKFPIIISAPNTDGHSIIPTSHLAMTYGLQQAIDFLFTSRMANVRKALNDMLIVDPARVEMEDVLNPEPGKIIRAKRSSFQGESLDSYIKQLNVADVTSGHANDAMLLTEIMRQSNGTVDITMGNLSNMPERPTATGIDAAKTGALSRLQRLAQIIGDQSMDDLAFMAAYNTIQYMEEDVAVSVLGRNEHLLRQAYQGADDVTVRWSDLSPYFEVEPHDGSMPNIENVQAWTTIMQTMLGIDGVAQEIVAQSDTFRIFQHWAKIAGAGDLNEFVRSGGAQGNTVTAPDALVEQQAQAGNLVPMEALAV